MTNILSEMTTQEAAASIERDAVVILPAGAMEQHGEGMPLGTDTIRGEGVARRVGDALGDRVVLGPTIPVGVSPHHLGFPGTITIRPATFATLLSEYLDSLAGHGWRRFLVITGHGGNNAALTTVAQELLRERPELEFAWTPVTPLAREALAAMTLSEVHGHSGEAETAQMLHLAPELVRSDLLAPGTVRLDDLEAADPLAGLARRTSQPTMALRYDRLSASGVLGDPRTATADQGRAIVDEVVGRIVRFVEEWSRP